MKEEGKSSSGASYNPQPGDYLWTTEIAPGNKSEIEKGATRARVMREYNRDKTMVEVEYGDYFDRAIVNKSSCTLIKHGEAPTQSWIDNPPVFT